MIRQKWFLLASLVISAGLWLGCNRPVPTTTAEQLSALGTKIESLQAEMGKLSDLSASDSDHLSDVSEKLDGLQANITNGSNQMQPSDPNIEETFDLEIHTLADAKDTIGNLGKNPGAWNIAEALATIDGWVIRPEEEKDFFDYKLTVATQLRERVKAEVTALQKTALEATSGAEGAKKHSEAGAILALYPMSEETKVIEEAKRLSSQQAALAIRLEVLQRQRYNHWAVQRIEAAIDGYNQNKSYLSPKRENPTLMDSLVASLKEIDPALLEPIVLELYNYVVDLTKSSISENDKIDLAKKMTDPSIKRKILGDF